MQFNLALINWFLYPDRDMIQILSCVSHLHLLVSIIFNQSFVRGLKLSFIFGSKTFANV